MDRVLVLNLYYEPSRVIDWQRAVCLIYDTKAEIVEAVAGEFLRSPSMSMPMPSIIRTLAKPRNRKVSVKFSRANVLLRDGYRCMYCGESFEARDLNYDHVLPRSRNGKTCFENIVAACYPCNGKKGDRTPAEARMPLLKTPRRPDWLPVMHKKFDLKTAPELWRPYLAKAA